MDIFGAWRIRWMFDRVFSGQNVRPAGNYSRINWWHDNPGIVAFQNEILKYVYYRLKY